MDGNGRMGRFLMNCLLSSSGYPWTVIPVQRRHEYMTALADASSRQNIQPFAQFIAGFGAGAAQCAVVAPRGRRAVTRGAGNTRRRAAERQAIHKLRVRSKASVWNICVFTSASQSLKKKKALIAQGLA
jgi:hypothetical protein